MESTDNDCPRFRPFASPNTQRMTKVKKAKYSTSLDPRGYIPVYEYLINGQPIMWDRESGYVHFTGIWKSLNNSKADIVKMVDSNPELKVKKIRGGFLKIQGTWIPYDYAYILCKRTAWSIRKELVSMFGPRFVNDALDPSHPEYGCLLLDPQSAQYQKGAMINRRSGFSTMRQANHPYKRDFARKTIREKSSGASHGTPIYSDKVKNGFIKKNNKIISSMSLSRLLNNNGDLSHLNAGLLTPNMELDDFEDENRSIHKSFTVSPNTTPSPTFRVIPSFPSPSAHLDKNSWNLNVPYHQLDQNQKQHQIRDTISSTRLLPPIFSAGSHQHCPQFRRTSEPRITPVYNNTNDYTSPKSTSNSSSVTWSPPVSPSATSDMLLPANGKSTNAFEAESYAKDIIDTISATILLQRLSQDDGARPFKPMLSDAIPSKVMIGNQEFRICWDN